MSRMDLTPAEMTAMGVLPSSVRSALMSRPGRLIILAVEAKIKPSLNYSFHTERLMEMIHYSHLHTTSKPRVNLTALTFVASFHIETLNKCHQVGFLSLPTLCIAPYLVVAFFLCAKINSNTKFAHLITHLFTQAGLFV